MRSKFLATLLIMGLGIVGLNVAGVSAADVTTQTKRLEIVKVIKPVSNKKVTEKDYAGYLLVYRSLCIAPSLPPRATDTRSPM
jgi:hypothetical protein